MSYTYDANKNRIGKTFGNGVTSTLTYDSSQRLTSITDLTPTPSAGTLLQEFQYGYDALSRRSYVKRNSALGDVYSYDADDQLTSLPSNSFSLNTGAGTFSITTSGYYGTSSDGSSYFVSNEDADASAAVADFGNGISNGASILGDNTSGVYRVV